MKQPEYNEIDSLLRSWAGRARSVSAAAAGNSADAHLDADELSSYAEGALPPATKARYTTHLVDCDDCRKVVAQLAVAAGPVMKESPLESKPEIAGWRKAVAAFFTPPVMKFALPALALMFAGVVFFASRRGSNRTTVVFDNRAQREQVAATGSPQSSKYADGNSAPQAQTAKPDSQATRATPVETKSGDTKQTESGATTGTGTYGGLAKQPEEPRKETAPVTTEDAEESTAAAKPAANADAPPPPAPAAKAPPKDDSKAADQVALRDKDKNERKRESERGTTGGYTATQPKAVAGEDDRQGPKTLAAARSAAGRRDEAEASRSVAGRRFERRNGVWIDTKYQSSMSTTNVARGSEQYRALIADEPDIAAVADQLKGDVFLVWKGRAYHLR